MFRTKARWGEVWDNVHPGWCSCSDCRPRRVGARTYWPEIISLALLIGGLIVVVL